MLKKFFIATAIFATSATNVLANTTPYLAGDLGILNNSSSQGNFRGTTGSMSAGIGMLVNRNVYFAGEMSFGVNLATINNNVFVSPGLKSTYSYDLSFIPGVMVSDHTLTYARAGIIRTRFSSARDTITGSRFGLGMQTSLTQEWELRGEYTYINYRSLGGISPTGDQFLVGLVYKID